MNPEEPYELGAPHKWVTEHKGCLWSVIDIWFRTESLPLSLPHTYHQNLGDHKDLSQEKQTFDWHKVLLMAKQC